ncbi:hypothetical protein [Defluviitalea phaphyphila]|uniref:hypothetical protein n=1 Tax=Defluviitalea phaphyphila TaxID=1473580 RepID=UPI000730415E|nr:hypothetical protein [Defluviitalea phaphyphila]
MICQRCNGQGEIYKAKVKNLGITLYICDECEACWDEDSNIELSTFQDLSTFLEQKGTSYNDADIEDLGYNW